MRHHCPELATLTTEFDTREQELGRAVDPQERLRIERRITELIRAIWLHRDVHAGCDFKATIQ